ncbi:GIY-YIG nuclease family protein [Microbulbifer sp.]|uniref:GIY-YIG nuclease family protein n=1 Tax=Microbulbifer sp. TaxID=1908541 RepID=UPI003F3E96A8
MTTTTNPGRSIRLFLVDGSPTGLLTAEIMNWTGHVLTGPRAKLGELVRRPEVARTGVYFLVGPDPDNNLRPLVYIGESDDVSARLKDHNRPETVDGPEGKGSKGGKDFWEKVCLVTSKDQNLTKAHVKHLESQLMRLARTLGRCTLVNGTDHDYINLPEADLADMAFFLEQIRTVLPVLGFDFLRDTARPPANSEPAQPPQESPHFALELLKHGVRAEAQEVDGEFIVLKGSRAREDWVGVDGGYQNLFRQMVEDGVLAPSGSGPRQFTSDCAFSSPSAAAAVVCGRSANGRITWINTATGQTYGAWQDQLVSSANLEEEIDFA